VLADALREVIGRLPSPRRASIILLKDFHRTYRMCSKHSRANGLPAAPSMPAARLELDFAISRIHEPQAQQVFRKNLRRKLRASEDAFTGSEMEVLTDATHLVDEIHPLYRQTYERSDFKFEEFEQGILSRSSGNDCRTRCAISSGAGRTDDLRSTFARSRRHMHDLDVGLDYSVALDLHMYFVTSSVPGVMDRRRKSYVTESIELISSGE